MYGGLNLDGLPDDRPIGLWNTLTGELLASVTIKAGGGASLFDQTSALYGFHYLSMESPVSLDAGVSYTLGVLYKFSTSPGVYHSVNDIRMSPGVNYGNPVSAVSSNTLVQPTTDESSTYSEGLFGPNIRFDP